MEYTVRRYFPSLDPSGSDALEAARNTYAIDSLLEGGAPYKDISASLRGNSVHTLVLELGKEPGRKACNYDCPICFTRNRHDVVGMSSFKVLQVIDGVLGLGCKTVLIPGIGEVGSSRFFWNFIDGWSGREESIAVVLYTNGSFVHDQSVAEYVGRSNKEMIDLLASQGKVSLYVKFWTSRPEKSVSYYGLSTSFMKRSGVHIPKALSILLDSQGPEKLGIQVALWDDNVDEFLTEILPFAAENGLACFVEPVMPVPNAQGFSLSPENMQRVEKYFAVGTDYCRERLARELIVNVDTVSPCIQFPRLRQFRLGGETSLSEIRHSPPFRRLRSLSRGRVCACKDYLEGKLVWEAN